MKRPRITGLALVTVLALSALAASSASATSPLCYKVIPGERGTFSNSNCTTADPGGEYVEILYPAAFIIVPGTGCAQLVESLKVGLWKDNHCTEDSGTDEGEYIEILLYAGGTAKPKITVLPTVKTFKGSSKTSALSFAGNTVACEKGTNAGEITSTTTVGKLVIKLSGCKITNSKKEVCTAKSVGQPEASSEILTHTLKGELGTVKSSEAMSEVGLLLEPETAKKFVALASNKCSAEAALEGSIAGEVNPISLKQTTGYLILEATSGKQKIRNISVSSGEKTPTLEAFGVENATVETVDKFEFGGAIEIV